MSNMKISSIQTLNAMGIETWQLRHCQTVDVLFVEMMEVSQDFMLKTKKLLHAMQKTVMVPQKKIAILSFQATAFLQDLQCRAPKMIVALGEKTAQYLLNTSKTFETLRQTIHTDPTTQAALVVTYHPLNLLKNAAYKKFAWQDLQFINHTLKIIAERHNAAQRPF